MNNNVFVKWGHQISTLKKKKKCPQFTYEVYRP